MNKGLKIVGALILVILSFFAICFTGVFINNKVKLNQEAKKIKDYGKKVEINGQKMNVAILGEGDKTIVLLPGYMTAAPVIDFKPLTDELSKDYRVVVIEPFGYGLSDDTKKKRSVENIISEIHDVLSDLNITDYTLMGHSIFGVYSLDYIKKYPDEVNAFIGIDSSLPEQGGADDNKLGTIKFLSQSGLFRVLTKASPDMLNLPPVKESLKRQYEYLSLKNMASKATINEGEEMTANFEKALAIQYPKELPVLYFLATESTESDSNWLKMHQARVLNSVKSDIEVLDGGHYLHHTKSKEISIKTKEFLN